MGGGLLHRDFHFNGNAASEDRDKLDDADDEEKDASEYAEELGSDLLSSEVTVGDFLSEERAGGGGKDGDDRRVREGS